MIFTMSGRFAAAALALVLCGAAALAQPTSRVRGTVEQVDGAVLTVKSREGATLRVRLADNVAILAIVKASLADIKAGSYVGSAAVPQQGGLRALEVHIFPENMRGTGEGHRPHDLLPGSTMTNATVADTVAKVDGHTLTLKHKEGEHVIFVPSGTPIVTYVSGDRAELKPGVGIFIANATRADDGSLQAARVAYGRGILPPM